MDFDFIKRHINDSIPSLRLKYPEFADEILQIECRHHFRNKLPDFITSSQFIFPTKLAGEQASNQFVGAFNASLFKENQTVVDMTAGLGIDAMCIAAKVRNLKAFDLEEIKTDALLHNLESLEIENVDVFCRDSIEYLKSSTHKVDAIYVDPARRSECGGKLYILSDTVPDIVGNYDVIMQKCDTLIIKASPMVDLSACVKDLPDLRCIYVVSYKGECKEVLLVCGDHETQGVYAVEIGRSNTPEILQIRTTLLPENECFPVVIKSVEELEGKFLYEPGANLMKIGDEGALRRLYPGIKKISPNTRLYVLDRKIEGFPGKIFENIKFPTKRELKELKGRNINAISRNHPLSADRISSKYGLKGGEEAYLIGCRILSSQKPELILAERII
ncbi:MAG: hypothetical protein K2N03_07860 [Muribaculaceae bacterium]|nr:hypothetical protein [Muribaculaceae bacterium]